MTHPSRPSRPAAARAVPRRPQRARGDAQGRMIGFVVLGGGLLAVLVVGWMAMHRYMPVREAEENLPSDTRTFFQRPVIAKEGRARRVDAAQIEGDWEAAFLDYSALFLVRGDTYQVVLMQDKRGRPRRFSRGTYTLDGAMLTFTPDRAMGSPADDDASQRYLNLHHRPFTVELRMQGNQQTWFPGPADPQYPSRGYTHPMISYSGQGAVIWTRKGQ